MSSRPEPWEQQPGESSVAFQAFVSYRNMGLFRSLSKCAAEVGKTKSLIDRWSSAHSWGRRVKAYDADQDREDRLAVAYARRQMRDRHVELAKDVQEKLAERLEGLNAALLDASDVSRWLDVATKVERAALGEPDRVDLTGRSGKASNDTGPTADDFDVLSDEEIRTQLMMLQRELESELADLAEVDQP